MKDKRMKNSSRRKAEQALFGPLICCVALTACAYDPPHDREVSEFHPEQVSCALHSSSEPEAIMAKISKKNLNALPHMSHAEHGAYVDKILSDLKTLADQGDPAGMGFFGGVQYSAIVADIMNDKYGRMTGRLFPDYLHDNFVTAYTYIYLAADVENKYQKEIQEKVIDKLDQSGANETGLETPPAWIEEAKANAQKWVAYCAAR
jgi:hypothetical protein